MSTFALGVTSLVLGIAHAFDVDHVVAVTGFVTQDHRPGRALRYGLQFGIGHTVTVLVFGLMILFFRFVVSPRLSSYLEAGSGLWLITLGVWIISGVFRERKYIHDHVHQHGDVFHSHPHRHLGEHLHRHGATVTGLITGLAGTAGVMLFGPVVYAPSPGMASLFIVLYGLGVTGTMVVFGMVLGYCYRLLDKVGTLSKIISFITGALSVSLGIAWIAGTAKIL